MASFASIIEQQGLPASVHTERVILGSCLSDAQAVQDASAGLQVDDLSLDSHRRLYGAILSLFDAGTPVDLITVSNYLRKSGELQAIGGMEYISHLTESLPRYLAMGNYIRIVKDKSVLRSMMSLAEEIGKRCIDESEIAGDLIAEFSSKLGRIEAGSSPSNYSPICDHVIALTETMRTQRNRKQDLLGITTGVEPLDEVTGGYHDGELTYIGAAPGQGKTSEIIGSCYAASSTGTKCGIISLEMRTSAILRRLAILHSKLKPHLIRDPKLMNEMDFRFALDRIIDLGNLPVFACDQSYLRPHEIRSIARRMVENDGVQILYVDFVQIIAGQGKTEREAINQASAALRDIAKIHNIPVIAASQLTRRDGDMNRRPTMRDLRESGNLEQDAHNVHLVYRPKDTKTGEDTYEDEIIVGKAREGMVGPVAVRYDDTTLTFKRRS